MTPNWKPGRWVNKRTGKIITGRWIWDWAAQRFYVSLDKAVDYAGERRKSLTLYGDTPEWGRWHRLPENSP